MKTTPRAVFDRFAPVLGTILLLIGLAAAGIGIVEREVLAVIAALATVWSGLALAFNRPSHIVRFGGSFIVALFLVVIVLGVTFQLEARNTEPFDTPFEITAIESHVAASDAASSTFAWQVDIRNLLDEPIEIYAQIEFQDLGGAVLDSALSDPRLVQPHALEQMRGTRVIGADDSARVAQAIANVFQTELTSSTAP